MGEKRSKTRKGAIQTPASLVKGRGTAAAVGGFPRRLMLSGECMAAVGGSGLWCCAYLFAFDYNSGAGIRTWGYHKF